MREAAYPEAGQGQVVEPPSSHRVPSRGAAPYPRGSRIVSWGLLALGIVLGALRATGLIEAGFGGVDLTQPIVVGSWMAWTWSGAIFFGIIGLLLVGMTLWQALTPEAPRVGILRIETTPGDRLFISLLSAAFITLAWLGLFGAPLWGALALSLVWAAAVFRWV